MEVKGVHRSNDNNNRDALSRMIVCFMIDGSEKYTQMTFKAIESFQKTTPLVKVGLLIPPSFCSSDILHRFLERLPEPTRVETRVFQSHFNEWNPTQHKLDLVKFADRYDTIFWLDSDVLVYKDLSDFFLQFHHSSKNFAFTQDHVTSNDEFRKRWPNSDRFLFIPQAAFMGFKSRTMVEFFAVWEELWREWITPYPFFKYADPYPSFNASAFCIEQYALGMTVDRLLSHKFGDDVHIIGRNEILITDTTRSLSSLFLPSHLQSASDNNGHTTQGGTTLTGLPPYLLAIPNGTGSSYGLLSSFGLLSSYGSLSSLNIEQLSSAGLLSSLGILSSLNFSTSYNFTQLSSMGLLSSSSLLSSMEWGMLSSFGLISLSSYGSSNLSSLASKEDIMTSLALTGALSSLRIIGGSSSSSVSSLSSG